MFEAKWRAIVKAWVRCVPDIFGKIKVAGMTEENVVGNEVGDVSKEKLIEGLLGHGKFNMHSMLIWYIYVLQYDCHL